MEKLIKAVLQIQEYKLRADDDFVDRLNRQHTPTLLIVFTVLVTVKQYVGEPLSCWCPAQFTQAHIVSSCRDDVRFTRVDVIMTSNRP